MNIPSKSAIAHILVAALFVIMPLQQAQSAPGTLPTSPMYLATAVEPNVFFSLDDSGSMGWSPMLPVNLGGITQDTGIYYTGIPLFDGSLRFYYNPTWWSDQSVIPPVAAYAEAWALKSKSGNFIYYDTNVAYVPWSGVDGSGNPLYIDADPYNAPEDPNDWAANTIDLTVAQDYDDGNRSCTACLYLPVYYDLVDTDGDEIIHATNDTGTEVEIKATSAPFDSERTYAEELQNFANWFVYYRTRANTMRGGIGQIIHNATAMRMGLDVFNGGHQENAETMTDDASKLALLKSFYNISFGSTTPARTSLKRVGELFSGNTSNPTPIQSAALGGECQQNFTIMLSDGFWNGFTGPGVCNTDYDGSGTTDNGFDGDVNESVDDGMYQDSYSDTLADVAMHYYETDLSALTDNVPPQPGIDEAEHQHMVTYSIAFGVRGRLNPETQDPTDSGFSWSDPGAANEYKIDDLWHAAYNSRGQYLYAQDATGLANALGTSILDISSRSGTSTSAAANSGKLNADSVVYLGQYNSDQWQGNLMAFPIINLNTGELAATPAWEAGPVLTARDIAANPRVIITHNGKGAGAPDGKPFQWADLTSAQKRDLKTSPAGGQDVNKVGKARLAYIRGDRSDDGTGYNFRERISVLGDLINSGPVSVGTPNLSWPSEAPFPTGADAYSEFKSGPMAGRQQILYAGANDGMLHGFNGTTGAEELAYIPESVFSENTLEGLHYLTNPGYLHRYYVDSTPAVSDIFMPGAVIGGDWTTVLIGGLRAGGRGYYALDVTDPSTFSEANALDIALWEFTDADDPDLGYTYSKPVIALANNGRWVAIFGNGYNSTGTGEASLFVVDIADGVDGKWAGADYEKITTGVGTVAVPNGLATPALADLDGNGTVDRVYAGDLQGNMWAFDLTNTNSNKWKVAYKQGSAPKPLFTTQNNEPITSKPVLAKHPTQPDSNSPSNAPNVMVYFGSGQYLVEADKTDTSTQSFYGVWDKGNKNRTVSNLVEQTFDGAYTGRVLTRNSVDYASKFGWYFDLNVSGERSVTAAVARVDTVFFNTWVPEDDPCEVGGMGWKFAVDMLTGGSTLENTFDSNNDGIIDDNDYQTDSGGNQSTLAAISQDCFLPEPTFIQDLSYTADEALKVKALANVPSGRFSWLELIH